MNKPLQLLRGKINLFKDFFYDMGKHDSNKVAKIFIYNNNRILLLQKENGNWHLPGGHLKNNETPMEGLIREVREETGITNFTRKLYKQINNVYLFKGNTEQTKVILSNEHINYKWIPVNEVVKFNLTTDTKTYIKYI